MSNCGVRPFRPLLEKVDHLNDKVLFVERRRVAGMSILISRGFQVADGREVSGIHGVKEVVDVVLVIGGVAVVSNRGNRGGASVLQVGG